MVFVGLVDEVSQVSGRGCREANLPAVKGILVCVRFFALMVIDLQDIVHLQRLEEWKVQWRMRRS